MRRDTEDGCLAVVVVRWFDTMRDMFRVSHSAVIFYFDEGVVFGGCDRRVVYITDHQVVLVHDSKSRDFAWFLASMVLARQRGVIVVLLLKSCRAESRPWTRVLLKGSKLQRPRGDGMSPLRVGRAVVQMAGAAQRRSSAEGQEFHGGDSQRLPCGRAGELWIPFVRPSSNGDVSSRLA
jgi:hypothetical protein